ncbi:DUF1800 family protein [Marinicella sp. W31]|uniref:DUF1800 domain-containing protein n=1 Tax=Marinicella sp. W31 TaxID=3023713 RepID=UPI00375633FE
MENMLVPAPTDAVISEYEAARFLIQATYGAKLDEIRSLQRTGYEAWIDEQMAMPASLQEPCMQATLNDPNQPLYQNSRIEAWYLNSVEGEDQLRQRTAFALSQIFVVSSESGNLALEVMGLAKYYDYLAINAFGNYRDILEDITLNTMMGFYLGMFRNAKADPVAGTQPDENYAREILQLFSVGLHQLHMDGTPVLVNGNPIPTYNQGVIENFARIFTGWNYNGCPENNWHYCGPFDSQVNQYGPMQPIESYHDTGAKTLLNGESVAAGQTAQEDLDAALDNIFNHPNVPPFISKQLIQRFVTSNPSPAYVERVANVFVNNGNGVRGDLAAVIRSILLDQEARDINLINNASYGKLKEPIIRQIALWRAFNAKSQNGRFQFWNPEFAFQQKPLGSPSVFNFFAPSYQLPGPIRDAGLVSPEFQITNETTVMTVSNEFNHSTNRGYYDYFYAQQGQPLLQLKREELLQNTPAALIEHMNLLMYAGQMSANTRTVLTDFFESLESANPVQRIASLIYVVMLSPEYVVQR